MKVKYDKNYSISYLGNEGENQTKAKQKPNNSQTIVIEKAI
jgi:hypothetical protein